MLLEASDGGEEAGDIAWDHHDRKVLWSAAAKWEDIVEVPAAFEGGLLEKPHRRDGHPDGAGREVSLLGKMELEASDQHSGDLRKYWANMFLQTGL